MVLLTEFRFCLTRLHDQKTNKVPVVSLATGSPVSTQQKIRPTSLLATAPRFRRHPLYYCLFMEIFQCLTGGVSQMAQTEMSNWCETASDVHAPQKTTEPEKHILSHTANKCYRYLDLSLSLLREDILCSKVQGIGFRPKPN